MKLLEVIGSFDFEKVLSVTKFLNYKWIRYKVENIDDMKNYVIYHFNRIDDNTIRTLFDGFCLEIDWETGNISLMFILENSIGMFID